MNENAFKLLYLNRDFILPARMECQDRRKNGFVPTSPSGFTACQMNENAFAALSESSFILLARVEYRDARKNGFVPTSPSKFTACRINENAFAAL